MTYLRGTTYREHAATQELGLWEPLRAKPRWTSDFLRALQPLDEEKKLGPVLFQLPPFLKCDVALLKDFLSALPRSLRAAFEFRHVSWFTDEVYAALREANTALCNAESEKLETPDVQTANFAYLRLRKAEYSAKERKALEQRIAPLAQKGDVYVYFKHEDTPEGALHAEGLLAAVQGKQTAD